MNNYYQKKLVNTLLNIDDNKKTAKKVKKNNSDICSINSVTGSNIPSNILDMLNFNYYSLRESNNILSLGGANFTRDQIPKINPTQCNEIKAQNNIVSFENGKYYKFTGQNGETHTMACAYNRVKSPHSETIKGKHDSKSYKIGKFWNALSRDGTYISSHYSHDEQRKYLNDAGITEGIFTVRVGDQKEKYLYSNGNCGVAVPKSRYDAAYDVIKNKGRFFKDYEVGSIFKIDGEKYKLSKKHTLDIPYGVDIYNMERPAKKSS